MHKQSKGLVLVIVGPSGSGKDTLINWLRDALKDRHDVLFARRIITRPADSDHEDHDTMELEQFQRANMSGAFAVCWEAHDLQYGIPVSVKDHADKGGLVILNGARRALDDLEAVFSNMQIVHLMVDPSILAVRLSSRGRSSDTDLSIRLAQQKLDFQSQTAIVNVANNGPVEEAGQQLLALIAQHYPEQS